MALKHLRSSTANKRPQPSGMSDGQLAMNTASGSPGLFFKDEAGSLVKIGPVHVGSTAPNVSPASGGTAGNSIGEQWLDNSGGTYVFKIWDGSAWRSEAGEFVNATGDTMTGDLVMNNANVVFEGSVEDGFETTLTVVNPTADRTITLPNVTGTVVTTGDSGTVTSTMIADGTIVNADVNASAAIAGTKISPNFGSQTIQTTGIISAAGGSAAAPSIAFTGDTNTGIYSPGADQVAISTNGTGRLFVDSSGRLLVGTSSALSNVYVKTSAVAPALQIFGTSGSTSSFCITRGTGAASNLVLQRGQTGGGGGDVIADDPVGQITFNGFDGTNYRNTAQITSEVDAPPGIDDMPGRLVFSTTGDGSANPTERMRITSNGDAILGDGGTRPALSSSVTGISLRGAAANCGIWCSADGTGPLTIGRPTTDGTLIDLRQAGVQEGTVSVSGTTVSYNGGHLSRWSQLTENTTYPSLYKGTVMTNLDEMCSWFSEDGTKEDNEQLNKMAVSYVEADVNVAGVLVSIDDDGDLNIGMTGDMIIRIAEGITVQRGDLLMSAGDGTAKPQGDDIIRSKTIAKVTSTHVTCTYADGSYCVPCVLMAC
jgi:hypothetical protein